MNNLNKKDYNKYDYWCWENFFNKSEIKKFNKEINKNIDSKENPENAASNSKEQGLKNVDTLVVKLSNIDKLRYDLKFTVLINLSEKKYTGGDFKLFNHEIYTVDKFKNSGSVLMFKPYINHCVTPITSGERKTFTIFAYGPKWR